MTPLRPRRVRRARRSGASVLAVGTVLGPGCTVNTDVHSPPLECSIESDRLTVRAGDYGSYTRALPKVALAEGIRVQRLLTSDESLESVFSYLISA